MITEAGRAWGARMAALVLCLLAGCATLPDEFERVPSRAIALSSDTALGRLADHLEIADHGVLLLLRGEERIPAAGNVAGNPLATLQHVMQVQALVLHSGTASARMRSRTYQ